MQNQRVLMLGGTGVISRAIVAQLLADGATVTVVTRGNRAGVLPPAVEPIQCDRHDLDRLEQQLAGRSFDYAIDVICFDERDAADTLRLLRGRCRQLVVISSVAVYKRPFRSIPTREDAEELWDDPTYQYAFKKAAMERYLGSHTHGDPAITIARPSLTFGPGARNVGVLRQNYGIVERIRAGKPLVLFGDGTNPWSFSFAADVARGIVGLLGNAAAAGEQFHIASREPTLWADLYRAFGDLLGVEPQLRYVPSALLYAAYPDLAGHIYFEKSYPGLFDDDKLQRALPGFRFEIDLAGGVRQLLESWERDRLAVDPARDRLEDELVRKIESFSLA